MTSKGQDPAVTHPNIFERKYSKTVEDRDSVPMGHRKWHRANRLVTWPMTVRVL